MLIVGVKCQPHLDDVALPVVVVTEDDLPRADDEIAGKRLAWAGCGAPEQGLLILAGIADIYIEQIKGGGVKLHRTGAHDGVSIGGRGQYQTAIVTAQRARYREQLRGFKL